MTTLKHLALVFFTIVALFIPGHLLAQSQSGTQIISDEPLVFGTVHRPPFAYTDGDQITGFSIELMRAIADELGRDIVFEPNDRFSGMLINVRSGNVDGAIANISITAERERTMDFSQPIFGGGIQFLLPKEVSATGQVFSLLNRDVVTAAIVGIVVLFAVGLLMWVFERKHQPYFDRPARQALFPSFWWALNLVVNGGFEERMPRSPLGQLLSVILVISSLFIVSAFVATITASVTLTALQSNVQTIRDLETRVVGTIAGSTSADFLDRNEIDFQGYGDPASMLEAFERDDINTVVFDGPILAYYAQTEGAGISRLLDKVYRPENYGIVLPSGSALKEDIDQVLLELREDGTYDEILRKWFGNSYAEQ